MNSMNPGYFLHWPSIGWWYNSAKCLLLTGQVIILSGDYHYAFATRLDYWGDDTARGGASAGKAGHRSVGV